MQNLAWTKDVSGVVRDKSYLHQMTIIWRSICLSLPSMHNSITQKGSLFCVRVKTLFAFEASIWVKVNWKFKATCEMINSFMFATTKERQKERLHVLPRGIQRKPRADLWTKKEDYFIESHKQKSSSESINKTTNNFD